MKLVNIRISLNNLKTKVDGIDTGIENCSYRSEKIERQCDKDVVKKTVQNKLNTKKIHLVQNKIFDISNLVTSADLNREIGEIEEKDTRYHWFSECCCS